MLENLQYAKIKGLNNSTLPVIGVTSSGTQIFQQTN